MKISLRDTSGVTLIELMLVMTILAVGSAMAIPQIQKSADKRKMGIATQSLASVADALRLYKLDYESDDTVWELAGKPTAVEILDTLEDKGYFKIGDLFQKGACYQFGFVGGPYVYKMSAFPEAGGSCDYASERYFWYSFDIRTGRADDKKGLGTLIVRSRRQDTIDF